MFLNNTIIPSVRKYKHFEQALACASEYVLLSEANIGNLQSLIGKCHQRGKKCLFTWSYWAVLNPTRRGSVCSKITTRLMVLFRPISRPYAMPKEGLLTIFRVLLIDSRSLDHSIDIVKHNPPDAIEILPAEYACQCLELISRNLKGFDVIFIAGGFVKRKYLVDKIFHAGFKGITTSEPGLW